MNKEFQEKIYDTDSDKTDIQTSKNLRINKVLKIIGNVEGKKILDVGCFNGEMISSLARNNECYGLDIAETPLKIAKTKGIKTSKLDFEKEKFPFEDNFFDIIICSETLEHLINQDHCLSEIRRVLKNDEIFIMTIPNINTPLSWIAQIFLDYPPIMSARYRSAHFRDFTKKIGESMLKINGFKDIKVFGLNIYPFNGTISRFFAKIFPRLSGTIIYKSKKGGELFNLPEVVFSTKSLIVK